MEHYHLDDPLCGFLKDRMTQKLQIEVKKETAKHLHNAGTSASISSNKHQGSMLSHVTKSSSNVEDTVEEAKTLLYRFMTSSGLAQRQGMNQDLFHLL